VDLADQYLDIPYGNLHKRRLITKNRGGGPQTSSQLPRILAWDLCFRILLRRSDYWLDVYMSYVIFGPKAGSSAGGT
jgi:hypothetical protein